MKIQNNYQANQNNINFKAKVLDLDNVTTAKQLEFLKDIGERLGLNTDTFRFGKNTLVSADRQLHGKDALFMSFERPDKMHIPNHTTMLLNTDGKIPNYSIDSGLQGAMKNFYEFCTGEKVSNFEHKRL